MAREDCEAAKTVGQITGGGLKTSIPKGTTTKRTGKRSVDRVPRLVSRGAAMEKVMPEFKYENLYFVLKRSDIRNSLSFLEQQILQDIAEKVHHWRTEEVGRDPRKCVVVESDWPEYEPTWHAIKQRTKA